MKLCKCTTTENHIPTQTNKTHLCSSEACTHAHCIYIPCRCIRSIQSIRSTQSVRSTCTLSGKHPWYANSACTLSGKESITENILVVVFRHHQTLCKSFSSSLVGMCIFSEKLDSAAVGSESGSPGDTYAQAWTYCRYGAGLVPCQLSLFSITKVSLSVSSETGRGTQRSTSNAVGGSWHQYPYQRRQPFFWTWCLCEQWWIMQSNDTIFAAKYL